MLGTRRLEEWEAAPLFVVAAILAGLAALSIWKPGAVAWPFAIFAGWIAFSFLTEAVRLLRSKRS